MKTYTPDEILSDRDIIRLTDEAMTQKPRSVRPFRPLIAVAASLALVLGIMNAGVIADGFKSLMAYFSGVGALEETQDLLIQDSPIEFTQSGFTWLIEGARQQDGILRATVMIATEQDMTDLASKLNITLLSGEEQRRGKSYIDTLNISPVSYRDTVHDDDVTYIYEEYMIKKFPQATSYGVFDVIFETEGLSPPYTLQFKGDMKYYATVTRATGEKSWQTTFDYNFDHKETFFVDHEAELTLAEPQAIDAIVTSMEVEHGVLTAMVSLNRDRITLYIEPNEAALASDTPRVNQLLAHPMNIEGRSKALEFIDEWGNAYEGVLKPTARSNMQSPEYVLLDTPAGEIVGIRIIGLSYSMSENRTTSTRPSGPLQIFKTYEPLEWYIPLKSQ